MEHQRGKGSFYLPTLCYPVDMDPYGHGGVLSVRRPLEVTNMSDIIDEASPHGCDNGALTDRFGVLIQALLAVVAFSTLMCKWHDAGRTASTWTVRLKTR